jgi:hypothetical protein
VPSEVRLAPTCLNSSCSGACACSVLVLTFGDVWSCWSCLPNLQYRRICPPPSEICSTLPSSGVASHMAGRALTQTPELWVLTPTRQPVPAGGEGGLAASSGDALGDDERGVRRAAVQLRVAKFHMQRRSRGGFATEVKSGVLIDSPIRSIQTTTLVCRIILWHNRFTQSVAPLMIEPTCYSLLQWVLATSEPSKARTVRRHHSTARGIGRCVSRFDASAGRRCLGW